MIRPLAAAIVSSLSAKASSMKAAVKWPGIRRRGGVAAAVCPPPRPEPAPQRLDASPLSRDAPQRFAVHYLTDDKLGYLEGDKAKQLRKLKICLASLGTSKPKYNPGEIMNDPGLDLKKFPLLSEDDVVECISKHILLLDKLEAIDNYYHFLMFLVIGDYIKLGANRRELVEILSKQHAFPNLDIHDLIHGVNEYVQFCDDFDPSCSEISKNKLLTRIKNDRECVMSTVYTNDLVESVRGPLKVHRRQSKWK